MLYLDGKGFADEGIRFAWGSVQAIEAICLGFLPGRVFAETHRLCGRKAGSIGGFPGCQSGSSHRVRRSLRRGGIHGEYWAGLSARAEAHVGSRVFPIPELTGEMLAGIELDGYVYEEWFDQIGEPALTSVDFLNTGKEPHDPADMDFRIWLAWHDEPARLYVAFVAADDSYWNTFTYEESTGPDNMMTGSRGGNDGLVLGVDGDHSGGPGFEGWVGRDRIAESSGNAQAYHAVSRTPSGPILDDPKSRHNSLVFSWMTLPPYAEAAGKVVGEGPVIWSIELYVTPFDHRESLTSPEGSVVSDLSAGQIIGFAIGVYESDAGDEHDQLAVLAPEAHATGSDSEILDDVGDFVADNFLDGLLLPAGGTAAEPIEDTAVESVSWGRIKAALEMEQP